MIGFVVFLAVVYIVVCILTIHEEGGKYAPKWGWPVDAYKALVAFIKSNA